MKKPKYVYYNNERIPTKKRKLIHINDTAYYLEGYCKGWFVVFSSKKDSLKFSNKFYLVENNS